MRKLLGGLIVLALLSGPVAAQQWPARTVTMIVAGAAGSAPDVIARILADRLTTMWGKPVVIDNKVGAAGVIGTEVTIFEPLAVAFAEAFLRAFDAGSMLGWAVRDARLALLGQGNPLGLVYIPFAAADLELA